MEIKDIGGFAKPATKLLGMVGKAVGVLFEPTRIRREARAQAEALLIKTSAELAGDELRRRAADRFITQEIRKQENLEAVVAESAALVEGSPDSEKEIDSDWINRFVLEAQEISDERLQSVWAKLLAGEFRNPGKFPRRLFRLLKELEPSDAALIETFAMQLLRVEDHDGAIISFLHPDITQQWWLGREIEEEDFSSSANEHRQLLIELGVIAPDPFHFEISVEGSLQPDKIHLSSGALRRIFAGSRELVPAHVQPAFIRTKGPSMSPDGRLLLNIWTKRVVFNVSRVTLLGEGLFALTVKTPDPSVIRGVREHLLRAGTVFERDSSDASAT